MKSGQTKMKFVLFDFLVGDGIKATSMVSYNHLGNNDSMNIVSPQTFCSREISKSNVDDMIASNGILHELGKLFLPKVSECYLFSSAHPICIMISVYWHTTICQIRVQVCSCLVYFCGIQA